MHWGEERGSAQVSTATCQTTGNCTTPGSSHLNPQNGRAGIPCTTCIRDPAPPCLETSGKRAEKSAMLVGVSPCVYGDADSLPLSLYPWIQPPCHWEDGLCQTKSFPYKPSDTGEPLDCVAKYTMSRLSLAARILVHSIAVKYHASALI
ncbi:hypothetical protein KIPB_009643 [Kipferlia bialata]|uniref:Uncharacterized protein n=1 Tax=Kipferlia bialata TaxID=797122 RepID=A0A9K3D3Y3_9EUKA|nr:hypothetical protein KIPB_009643 [Kipferlia bialata]|eukprot:g9643.t1